jgi:serine/threonine protein kinase
MAQELVTKQTEALSKNLSKSEAEAELGKTLGGFLSGYVPANSSGNERDVLAGRYKIELNSPLPDFTSKSANAYAVTDLKTSEKDYVALVCESNTIQRTQIISPLTNAPHPNLMAIITSGVVEISQMQEERFVIIYERQKGDKLSKLIAATKNRPNFEFICQAIISPLAMAIQHLHELGVSHGNINCDNIYYDTSGTIGAVIGPCTAEPCGFIQPFYYEPVERMQALPAGKGDGDSTQDFYALAVVVLHIIYGMNHFTGITEDMMTKGILRKGAFETLTRQKDMPEVFYDFFRGMLSHNSHDRWNYRYLKAWLDGKRYNVMPPPPPQEAIRPFEFEGDLAYTRREAANIFFHHWQHMPDIFASGQLSTWVAISLRNKELNEYLLRTTKVVTSAGKKTDPYMNEQIMRAVAVFDPAGPVRLVKLSFHLDGINTLFADLLLTKSEPELLLLMQFIELSMFHFIAGQKNKDPDKRLESDNSGLDAIFMRLDRLRSVIRNSGIGFGIERILYDLNPGIKCMSPMLTGLHVSSLSSMLKTLDRLAPRLSQSNDPIDKHIAAFIASHLNIQHDIHLVSLSAQPTLAKHQAMIALKIIASAQQKTGLPYLPGLTSWLAIRILPLLDVIRSRTLKRKLVAMLANAARSGSTQKMAEVLIESGYAQAEASAFQQAIHNFKQNANDIIYYNRKEMIDIHSKRLGAKMAHYIAIAALLLSFVASVRGG